MTRLNHFARILIVMLLLSGCASNPGHYCNRYEGDIFNNEGTGTGKGKVIIGLLCGYDDPPTYEGDFVNALPHGIGKMTWPTGDFYEGEFIDGKRSGQGREVRVNGDFYEGGWLNDNRIGQGKTKWTYPNGLRLGGQAVWGGFLRGVYEGSILNNMLHGWGRYSYASGEIWEGQFSFGNPVPAKGTFKWPNGGTWTGKDSIGVGGRGIYTFSSGDSVEGVFVAGKIKKGIYKYADGNVYEGSFDNLSSGFATINIFSTVGITGTGSLKYPNGDLYKGAILSNQRHGFGVQKYSDGRSLEGTWVKDVYQEPDIVPSEPPPVIVSDTSPNESYARKNSGKLNTVELIPASSGSGFAVSSEGYVITNFHVVSDCQAVDILYQGKSIPTTVIAYDAINDLALLKADFTPSAVFPISDRSPEILQNIYVAGFPFGKAISGSVKVTKGIISSLVGIRNNFSNMQIDAALQPGNSGGPILDEKGNVVGVAVAKLDFVKAIENFDAIPEGTNFGIKASVVRSILQSNNIVTPKANSYAVSTTRLGTTITNGTLYLSCSMTLAKISEMRSKKVLFEITK
jgi:hypothetical protein